MRVAMRKGAVMKAATGRSRLCSRNKTAGEVDAGRVNLRILLRESTGIKARSTAKLKNMRTLSWPLRPETALR